MSFEPERWLSSLEPIGWRFGLERIRALLAALGDPQDAFESVHVVGTNGKSSVAAMTAALLGAAGRRAGCYLSPHTGRWSERIVIEGKEIGAVEFAAAASAVAAVLPGVEDSLGDEERVTQFEAATAVAFHALASAGVEVGVIEAGLGGRLDATNVLRSRTTALTSVGLDHTAWLGDTEAEIAKEKLAVLRDGSTLVLGRVSAPIRALALEHASARGASVVEASGPPPGIALEAPFLERNLAVALAAAGSIAGEIRTGAVLEALDSLALPGRFELLESDPPVVLDAAHNVDGAAALAEALGERFGNRPVVGCLAIMADKDAWGIVRALAPALSAAVATQIPEARLKGSGRPGAGSVSAGELGALLERANVPATVCEDPREALTRALDLARARGGVASIAGSHYLLPYGWTERPAQSSFK